MASLEKPRIRPPELLLWSSLKRSRQRSAKSSFHFTSGVSQSIARLKFAPGYPACRGFQPGRGKVRSWGAARPCDPPGIAFSPWSDPVPAALRSHHAILYARLGGASSARSDEQPGAGVDLKRVQRERGPVQLRRPTPAHPARFTVRTAPPGTCRARPSILVSAAIELGPVVAGRTPDTSHICRVAKTLTTQ